MSDAGGTTGGRPEVGAPAPDFTAPTDGGGTLQLSALRGRKVVLYFYPRDNTPGCTREAEGFRDRIADFEAAGAVVVGVSRDSVRSHDRFKAKHGLPFALVSDEDGAICEAYGTWVEKRNYGRTYMGIQRATFLIDEDGIVRHIWPRVKVAGHVDEVLAAVQGM